MKLLIASKNQGKIKEIIDILSPLGFDFKTLDDFPDAPEVQETGETFCENAIIKAKALAEFSKMPTIADDSGLVVDHLHGKPGIQSARYAGPEQNMQRNISKVVTAMFMVPCEKRTARFKCCIALAYPDGKVITAEGELPGKVVGAPRGAQGFGYDPIFMPDGYEKTFGELEPEVKNSISHRHQALIKLHDLLSHKPKP